MVFSLMPDYTYKIGPVSLKRVTQLSSLDTPNQHTLDVLDVMRKDPERRAWTAAELS